MRHNLCRSFHPWCPGVKNRCLYSTEGSPVTAAIMSFESSLWLKNRGSCVQACGVIYEGTPLTSSTFGLGTFFLRLAFIVKLNYCFFVCIFLFCFALFIVHPGLYWLWIKVSITVTPHEHHGVSEQRQLLIKGQNSALLTHCEGGGGGGGGGTPVISGFPSKGAINAENVSMLCGWKCLKSGTHIKYHV